MKCTQVVGCVSKLDGFCNQEKVEIHDVTSQLKFRSNRYKFNWGHIHNLLVKPTYDRWSPHCLNEWRCISNGIGGFDATHCHKLGMSQACFKDCWSWLSKHWFTSRVCCYTCTVKSSVWGWKWKGVLHFQGHVAGKSLMSKQNLSKSLTS